ncbi:MAG TPA: VWA domain-containing protein [Candidatus Limnocylindrales bacterium]|nr:VWA domain-containing protein [Candidatus Limnocylindrales bacterium]
MPIPTSLIWPPGLLFLLLVPLGILLVRAMDRGRRRRAAAISGLIGGGPASSSPASPARRMARRAPAILLAAGFVLLGLAIARPQGTVTIPTDEGIVILAFDVSASMGATDLQPTRIAAAQAAAKAFVERQPSSVVVGIVAFSDAGLTTVPPSTDQAAILAAIDRLRPARGTSVGQGILASLHAIEVAEAGPGVDYYSNRSPAPTATPTPVPSGYHAPASIILLTDGDNNEPPDPIQAAQSAADEGVRIYPVGIGSDAGTTVNLDGFQIHTQLDSATLKQIASVSGGTYYAATDTAGLNAVYDQLDTSFVLKPEQVELTGVFAGLAVLLFVLGGVGSLMWLGYLP